MVARPCLSAEIGKELIGELHRNWLTRMEVW